MRLIVDTREQACLWLESSDIIRRKLDEGDYACEELEHEITVERKSPGDLYGSILQGHERFRREIHRSIDKDKDFYCFVECKEKTFVKKRWKGAKRLKGTPALLAAIVKTLQEEYDIIFVWCEDRDDMRKKMIELFNHRIEMFK